MSFIPIPGDDDDEGGGGGGGGESGDGFTESSPNVWLYNPLGSVAILGLGPSGDGTGAVGLQSGSGGVSLISTGDVSFTDADGLITLEEIRNGVVSTMVRAYRDATIQSISTATHTAIQLNAESFDDANYHDNVTANTRFTVPTGGAGRYRLVGQIEYAGNATGYRHCILWLNGTGTGTRVAQNALPNLGAGFVSRVQVVSGPYTLADGDFIELGGYQDSGGPLNVNNGSGATFMVMEKC